MEAAGDIRLEMAIHVDENFHQVCSEMTSYTIRSDIPR